MSRIPMNILVLALAALIASGCAKDSKVAIAKTSTNPQNNSAAGTPLTPLTDDDYKVRSVHELMRTHMSVLNLLSPPKVGSTEGCISIEPGNAKSTFIAKYDCTWTESSSEPSHGELTWSLKNNENYVINPNSVWPYQASASLKTLVLRSVSPQKIAMSAIYFRNVSLVPDPKTAGQYKMNHQSSFGNSADKTNQNWQTKIQGAWSYDATKGLTLIAGSTLIFTHNLPSNKKINSTIVTYTVGDKGLTFDPTATCSRPVGSMTWTKKYNGQDAQGATATGTLLLSQTEASDGVTDIVWPKDSCLEFEGKKL